MKIKTITQSGEKLSDTNAPDEFNLSVNDTTLTNYINHIRSVNRNTISNTLTRNEVSGGGKKPWQQKGTGRARHGSIRSPLWVGGGVTFGPRKDRNYKIRINKKVKKPAINHILSHFVSQKRLLIIKEIALSEIKTSAAEKIIESLQVEGKISLVLSNKDKDVALAFKNLPYVALMTTSNLDTTNLISSDYIIFTKQAFKELY